MGDATIVYPERARSGRRSSEMASQPLRGRPSRAAVVAASNGGVLNIDHVVSDAFDGECRVAGLTEGFAPVIDAVHFDHKPVVCEVRSR